MFSRCEDALANDLRRIFPAARDEIVYNENFMIYMTTVVRRRIRYLNRNRPIDQQVLDAEEQVIVQLFEGLLTSQGLKRAVDAGEGFRRAQGTLGAWLTRQAVFQANDWFKKQRNLRQIAVDPEQFARDTLDRAGVSLLQIPDELRAEFGTLPRRQHAICIAHFLRFNPSMPSDDFVTQAEFGLVRMVSKRQCESLKAAWLALNETIDLRHEDVLQQLEALSAALDFHNGEVKFNRSKHQYLRRILEQHKTPSFEIEQAEYDASKLTLPEIEVKYSANGTLCNFCTAIHREQAAMGDLEKAQAKYFGCADTVFPTVEELAELLCKKSAAVGQDKSRAFKTLFRNPGSGMDS